MRIYAVLLLLLGCTPMKNQNDQEVRSLVLETLRPLLTDSAADGDTSIRINIAPVDLDGDGVREVIAYVDGDTTCGSGGCSLYILRAKNSGYEPITKLTITWPPIRILDSKSNGWQDIAVWVQGGGIQPGYEARLRFDGKTYPSNPSLVPREENGPPSGRIVIDRSSPATPLY